MTLRPCASSARARYRISPHHRPTVQTTADNAQRSHSALSSRSGISLAWNVKMASSQDAWYLSLLGLAENFRTSKPPNIKSCIQCLQAVFNFKPPQRVEARTHLQLGHILLTHTKNSDLARSHLEQAVSWCFVIVIASRLSLDSHRLSLLPLTSLCFSRNALCCILTLLAIHNIDVLWVYRKC